MTIAQPAAKTHKLGFRAECLSIIEAYLIIKLIESIHAVSWRTYQKFVLLVCGEAVKIYVAVLTPTVEIRAMPDCGMWVFAQVSSPSISRKCWSNSESATRRS
jgi:hypothetical protein